MVTALVLQLIQCVVHLPSEKDLQDEHDKKKVCHTILLVYIIGEWGPNNLQCVTCVVAHCAQWGKMSNDQKLIKAKAITDYI